MRLATTILLPCLAMSALVACNDQRAPSNEAPRDTATEQAAASAAIAADSEKALTVDVAPTAVPEGPTRGGDGSQIALRPLSAEQLESANLPGELACSFADADAATLLVARADVLPDGMVHGVVNHNGYVETFGNGSAGGFNDLLDGITLTGKGLTVVLVRGAPQPTGNESSRHAATLTVQRADGAERNYNGTLTCGP